VPVHTAEKITKLTRMARELSVSLGREATFEEIAGEAQLTADEVERLLSVDRDGVSLQTSVGDESFELGDLIEDADLTPVAEIVSIGVRNDELHKRVNDLPRREAQILHLASRIASYASSPLFHFASPTIRTSGVSRTPCTRSTVCCTCAISCSMSAADA